MISSKHFYRTLIVVFAIGALLLPASAIAKTTFISIGTGGTGGIYYPYGGGVAEIWSKYVPDIKAVAEVTGASVENVKLAHKGETVVGEVMGDVAVAGFEGLSKFQGKKHDILSMAIMYPNLLQVVTLKKAASPTSSRSRGATSAPAAPAAAPISWPRRF
jgi:TRAP transporter TAXI family solute receptor